MKLKNLTNSQALIVAKQITAILILNASDVCNEDDSILEDDIELINIFLTNISKTMYDEELNFDNVKDIINKTKELYKQ